MAAAVGCGSASGSWAQFNESRTTSKHNNNKNKKKGFRVCCVSSTVSDPYKTLRIQPGASESEVKKAFRQLALQYHPDVCRGNDCGIQFHQINEAYDIVMSQVRDDSSTQNVDMYENYDVGPDEPMRGMFDQDWDMWEEWMDGKELEFVIILLTLTLTFESYTMNLLDVHMLFTWK